MTNIFSQLEYKEFSNKGFNFQEPVQHAFLLFVKIYLLRLFI